MDPLRRLPWRENFGVDDVGFGSVVEGEVLAVVVKLRGGSVRGCRNCTAALAAADDLGGEVVDCHSCRLALLCFPAMSLATYKCALRFRFVTSDPDPAQGFPNLPTLMSWT